MTLYSCRLQRALRCLPSPVLSQYSLGLLTGALGVLFTSILCILVIRIISSRYGHDLFKPSIISYRKVPKGPRILCMVSTAPVNYRTKAVHVAATWAGRCDHTVFLSSTHGGLNYWSDQYVAGLNIMEVPAGNLRADMWDRVKLGLKRIWKTYGGEFDFLVKADDDTYLIIENLKHKLSSINPREKMILGHYQQDQNISYMSGGSGYVISAAGVQSMVEQGLAGQKPCLKFSQQMELEDDEDVQIGACAKVLDFKVYTSETEGKITFFPFKLETFLIPELVNSWWRSHSLECREKFLMNCASDFPISFHYVTPVEMYRLEYLLYRVKIFHPAEEIEQKPQIL
ncbi:glycoprotein-N-acetylgalactosamine 3-beta-galactosyltransferase 1 isoform X2 [Eurytemora carolleeae]|uniref:glycoprotein-N-acetylgalactosamine 3-beta-galactosyltransferase 1 isoform X2 n=1 Tax=Eurytemora carolleeae TaxID=1294199 RepID=UPI000C75B4E5|nr:glycoprotein-N-acetylgalactosamine 3-beta-galactosyltransferase 1 isoform X2 [Eurytemora carolleeae]|eukprot:XP_023339197.1 glycoprotein-N-acetylgalactosamine 3-beta-galactosyltransferase 1-like isoform X2 [Eurytemora affinis]